MAQEKQNLLEMLDRPALIVRDGIIADCNKMAKNRMIATGTPITQLLSENRDAYRSYQGGVLYLTLQLGSIPCGATVVREPYGDVFLLDRDTDQAQLQALALAAQQLRVPLSNAMVLADSLFPELEEESQQEQAAQMNRALFQLMRLIGNMADADRYTRPEMPHYENTELCAFFQQIAEKANGSLEPTQVSVRYSCPGKPIFTVIDRERMERAVYNLLSNAVKFSQPGGSVEVKLTRSGEMACLCVENRGDSISPHVQGTLFHRYLREPAIEDSRFGLGLGMTLVRTAAAIHGGTVLLEQTDCTRVVLTMAICKSVPGTVHSPKLRIGDYAGGRDLNLLEFAETLPSKAYEKNI